MSRTTGKSGRHPRLVAAFIQCLDDRIAPVTGPANPPMCCFIDLDRTSEVGIQSHARSIEITLPIDGHSRIAERIRAVPNRWEESARPGATSIPRGGETRPE